MSHLATLLQRFAKDEGGAALVEYVVIFAVLMAGAIGLMTTISTNLNDVLTDVGAALATVAGLN